MLSFVEKHPGTILEATGFNTQEEFNTFINTYCRSSKFMYWVGVNDDFEKFRDEYVFNGTRLEDVTEKIDVCLVFVSSWASDICGTIISAKEKVQDTSTIDESPKPKKSGFDIYEYAEKMPYADYMDMHTGLIYHIPEYIAVKNNGDESARIRVTDNGVTIGYAEKL